MKCTVQIFFLTAIMSLATTQSSQAGEPLDFSLLFHAGADYSTGFIPGYQPAPELGVWLGIGLNNRVDGLWGIDYYTMPGDPVTLTLPSPSEPVSISVIMPTDDIALSINTRWYFGEKSDEVRHRYNTVPYLLGGLGMDLLVDQFPRDPGLLFYNASFDVLFALNLGAGLDIPVDRTWLFYTEGLDHLIFWQGLTQVYSLRVGFKVMLDSAHIDPFR